MKQLGTAMVTQLRLSPRHRTRPPYRGHRRRTRRTRRRRRSRSRPHPNGTRPGHRGARDPRCERPAHHQPSRDVGVDNLRQPRDRRRSSGRGRAPYTRHPDYRRRRRRGKARNPTPTCWAPDDSAGRRRSAPCSRTRRRASPQPAPRESPPSSESHPRRTPSTSPSASPTCAASATTAPDSPSPMTPSSTRTRTSQPKTASPPLRQHKHPRRPAATGPGTEATTRHCTVRERRSPVAKYVDEPPKPAAGVDRQVGLATLRILPRCGPSVVRREPSVGRGSTAPRSARIASTGPSAGPLPALRHVLLVGPVRSI
jgi:hypothetical protein